MKLPRPNLKTSFWTKELPEFKEGVINLLWFFIIIGTVNALYNMAQYKVFGTAINLVVILIIVLIIASYNKSKKKR